MINPPNNPIGNIRTKINSVHDLIQQTRSIMHPNSNQNRMSSSLKNNHNIEYNPQQNYESSRLNLSEKRQNNQNQHMHQWQQNEPMMETIKINNYTNAKIKIDIIMNKEDKAPFVHKNTQIVNDKIGKWQKPNTKRSNYRQQRQNCNHQDKKRNYNEQQQQSYKYPTQQRKHHTEVFGLTVYDSKQNIAQRYQHINRQSPKQYHYPHLYRSQPPTPIRYSFVRDFTELQPPVERHFASISSNQSNQQITNTIKTDPLINNQKIEISDKNYNSNINDGDENNDSSIKNQIVHNLSSNESVQKIDNSVISQKKNKFEQQNSSQIQQENHHQIEQEQIFFNTSRSDQAKQDQSDIKNQIDHLQQKILEDNMNQDRAMQIRLINSQIKLQKSLQRFENSTPKHIQSYIIRQQTKSPQLIMYNSQESGINSDQQQEQIANQNNNCKQQPHITISNSMRSSLQSGECYTTPVQTKKYREQKNGLHQSQTNTGNDSRNVFKKLSFEENSQQYANNTPLQKQKYLSQEMQSTAQKEHEAIDNRNYSTGEVSKFVVTQNDKVKNISENQYLQKDKFKEYDQRIILEQEELVSASSSSKCFNILPIHLPEQKRLKIPINTNSYADLQKYKRLRRKDQQAQKSSITKKCIKNSHNNYCCSYERSLERENPRLNNNPKTIRVNLANKKAEDLFLRHKNQLLQKLARKQKDQNETTPSRVSHRIKNTQQYIANKKRSLSPQCQEITNRLYGSKINQIPCDHFERTYYLQEKQKYDEMIEQYPYLKRYLNQKEIDEFFYRLKKSKIPQPYWVEQSMLYCHQKMQKINRLQKQTQRIAQKYTISPQNRVQ